MLSSSRKMPTTSAPQIPFRLPTPPSGCTRIAGAASRPRAFCPSEPPRLSRRRSRWAFHAAMAVVSSCSEQRAPAAAGGTGPMGPRRRRWSSRCARSLLRADLRLGGGEPHRLEAAPGAAPADRLGLEEPDHGLGRRGVERAPRPAPPDLRPPQGATPASARRSAHRRARGRPPPVRARDPRPAPVGGRRGWGACSSAPDPGRAGPRRPAAARASWIAGRAAAPPAHGPASPGDERHWAPSRSRPSAPRSGPPSAPPAPRPTAQPRQTNRRGRATLPDGD